MREIVLDTESTGLDPDQGHRVVEIGCVELFNFIPTGKTFQCYLNPDRDMPIEAQNVHGLSAEFLSDKPRFEDVAEQFTDFIADSPLIIHNAGFDMKFLNAELRAASYQPIPFDRAVDTVQMARRKYPGQPASLDALCKRFGIDNSAREHHGALLDAQLLAEVYLELRGGRQPDLAVEVVKAAVVTAGPAAPRKFREPRPSVLTAEEQAAFDALVAKIPNALWAKKDDAA